MSLQSKLEAVIYAAEEPVTLAQLAVLFADEALELKAAEEAARLDSEEQNASENQRFSYSHEATEELTVSPEADAEPEVDGQSADGQSADGQSADESPEELVAEVLDLSVEEKRLAKQREREARVVVKALIDQLIAQYADDARGIEIREIAGGYRMATKPECHDAVRSFVRSLKPAMKLSLPALETLAVIAYKQPATAPEVNEIRGVDSSGVFGSLLARKLIATAGRKQVIGRPILYKTTREFLLRFGLKDLGELPSMEEFEKLAALELDEPDTNGEPNEATPTPTVEEDSDEPTLNLAAPAAEHEVETAERATSATERDERSSSMGTVGE